MYLSLSIGPLDQKLKLKWPYSEGINIQICQLLSLIYLTFLTYQHNHTTLIKRYIFLPLYSFSAIPNSKLKKCPQCLN